MFYRPVTHYKITLDVNEEKEMDASSNLGLILKPKSDKDKIYVHWFNDYDKLQTTYTLDKPILVKNKFKLINGSNKKVKIGIFEL